MLGLLSTVLMCMGGGSPPPPPPPPSPPAPIAAVTTKKVTATKGKSRAARRAKGKSRFRTTTGGPTGLNIG